MEGTSYAKQKPKTVSELITISTVSMASMNTFRRRLLVLLLNQLTRQNLSFFRFLFLFFPLQPLQVCNLSKYIFAMRDFAQYLMGLYVNLILCYHCKDYIHNVHAVHYCMKALRQRNSTFNIIPNVNSILWENDYAVTTFNHRPILVIL